MWKHIYLWKGAVLYHHRLKNELSDKTKRIQRLVLKLLSVQLNLHFSYMEACIYFSVEQLFSRRIGLCERFVRRIPKNVNYPNLFMKRKLNLNVQEKRKFQEYKSYSSRHFNSPLVALTRIANRILWRKGTKQQQWSEWLTP